MKASLFFLVAIFGMLYYVCQASGPNEINYAYIVLGGFTIWIGVNKIIIPWSGDHAHQNGWMPELSELLNLFLLISGFILLILSVEKIVPVFMNSSFMQFFYANDFLFKLCLFLIAYSIFSFFVFEIRYIVKGDRIIILDDKSFFPGDKYVMLPFVKYKIDILEKTIIVPFGQVKIKCSDGEFETAFDCAINLDIEKARLSPITNFVWGNFVDEARRNVLVAIREQAKDLTCKQFLNKEMVEIEESATGLPFAFDASKCITHMFLG